MRPLSVYLDSSDFSVLSNAERASAEAPGVLPALQRWIHAGEIECFFSGAHLTEMAPLQATYANAAVSRSAILVALCGRNTMIAHDRLFSMEVRVALGLTTAPVEAMDREGYWFPEGAAELSPVTQLEHELSIKKTIGEIYSSRADRRRAQKRVMKGGKPRPEVQAQLLLAARHGALNEILETIPMRPDAARVLARYIVGDASGAEATAAFESSLRDPSWMVQWFYKHCEALSPFVSWARGPGRQLAGKMMKLWELVQLARANPLLDEKAVAEIYGPSKWAERQELLLAETANRFAAKESAGATLAVQQIDRHCPGLSAAIRSLFSAWQSITFERPRKPKPSDFVDALHAAYAPYVDVFRADGFMAAYIARQANPYGTHVVPKLSELPHAIERRLAQPRMENTGLVAALGNEERAK